MALQQQPKQQFDIFGRQITAPVFNPYPTQQQGLSQDQILLGKQATQPQVPAPGINAVQRQSSPTPRPQPATPRYQPVDIFAPTQTQPLIKNAAASQNQSQAPVPYIQQPAAAPVPEQPQQPKKKNPVASYAGNAVGTYAGAQAMDYLSPLAESAPATAAPVVEATGSGMMLPGMGGATVPTATAAGGAEAAGGTTASTLGTAASLAGAAYGAYRTYGAATNDNLDARERAFQTQRQAALAVANYFSFGLAGIADTLARANPTTGKWMQKFDKLDRKFGALGHASKLLAPLFGDIPSHKREITDFAKLVEKGVYVPDNLLAEAANNKRRTYEEMNMKQLPPDFIGRDAEGNWVNNKFNMSRDVEDLRPPDIVNYATFAEHDPEWFNYSQQERMRKANEVLEMGAVSEGHGQIQVDWDKVEQERKKKESPVEEVNEVLDAKK